MPPLPRRAPPKLTESKADSSPEFSPSLLLFIGASWSAIASAIGALVVALATWLHSDWVFPSVLSALVSFALPALAALAWRAFASRQHGEVAESATSAGPQTLKLYIGPEEWTEEALPCFSLLPRLHLPSINADGLRPSLLHEALIRTTVQLQPGVRAHVPLRTGSSRPPLVVATPSQKAAVTATLRVRPGDGPDLEPEVGELQLEFHAPLALLNVVPTLVNLHHIVENGFGWALVLPAFWPGDWNCQGLLATVAKALVALVRLLLMAVEFVATVQLTRVIALPYGHDRILALRFSGRVSLLGGLLRVPFCSVCLPDFILPRPHGRLVKLLSEQPLANAAIRNLTDIPMERLARAVSELVTSFEASAEVVVEVPDVDVEVCLPDATVIQTTARLGTWVGPSHTLRASASVNGTLSQESLRMVVQSVCCGSLCMSGSVEVASTLEEGRGAQLLEDLVKALAKAPTASNGGSGCDSARSGSDAFATTSFEWQVQEGSVLPDVYLNLNVHHPIMKCGHKLWGAAHGPTLAGSMALRGVEICTDGLCVCSAPPEGELRVACSDFEIPMAEPDSEPTASQPPSTCVSSSGMPASTFRTGSTVTALSLSGGSVDCCFIARAESKLTMRVDYGGSISIDTEADIGHYPELGVSWSDTLQVQSNARVEGALLAEWDGGSQAVEVLPATAISVSFSDSAVSLAHRVLRIPDASTVTLAVASCSLDIRCLHLEPCVDLQWHCGGGKSPTLQDVESDLPELELLSSPLCNGVLRLRMSSAGRVRIEDSPPRLLSTTSSLAALLPAISVVQQHSVGHVANWQYISAWLDPLSEEGARRWSEVLDSQELEEKVLLLCCILSPELQPVARRLFAEVHRLLKVLREEGIAGLRDIIPAEKLALVLARMLSADDPAKKELFQQLHQVVKGAVNAEGINIPLLKELLVSHIPLLEDYPFELDRGLRILHLMLSPTPPMPPIAGQYAYPVARRQQHQRGLRDLPSAAQIYAAVDNSAKPMQAGWVNMVVKVAPLLTCQQLEYVLSRRADWPPESLARLTYVFNLKKRVKQLSVDWGGVMHLPQTHMIALFLGNVVRASLRWPGRGIDNLPSEAQFLSHLRMPPGTNRPENGQHQPASLLPRQSSAPHGVPELPLSETSPPFSPSSPRDQVVCGSLLGPEDVAALLRIALANITQSYVDQGNFRMLLELTLSQPPNFLRGVLYELSDNGSQRNLTQVLLRLVDVRQDAFQTYMDIAVLFEEHLGISIPRRADFVAGGRWCRQSYYQEMFHAAAMILEEAEPYLAVQSHVQVALPPEEMLSCPGAGLDKGLTPGVEAPTKRAIAAIREADDRASAALEELRVASTPHWSLFSGVWMKKEDVAASGSHPALVSAVALYRTAFAACRSVLRQETPITLGREWFRTFWQRNHEALMVECLVRAVQQDVDSARAWLAVQPGNSEKALVQREWGLGGWANEQWLIDRIIETTYFFEEDRRRIGADPLVRLLLANDPSERYDFSVISVMGVVSQGAKGLELEKVYRRYERRRGVTFIRADTGTAKSHEYNAAKVEEAICKVRTKAWGIVGYSQGGANALKAESNLCGGTPEQHALIKNLTCRNLLFPAANGAVQATCGEWKVTRVILECEKLLKHYQASVSSSLQEAFLDLLWTVLSSRGLVSFIGGFHSLSHQGVQTLWREAQHKDGVPTTNVRGVVEEHTLPESLELMAAWHSKQLESAMHDTQVALDEAVGHPVHVHNANSAMLARCDLGGAVQRMSHWAPLDEATEFITTESDVRRHIYDIPKDRFIYPWLELNARFGFVPKVDVELDAGVQRMVSGGASATTNLAGDPGARVVKTDSDGMDGPFWKVENRVDSASKLKSLVGRQQRRRHKKCSTKEAAASALHSSKSGVAGAGESREQTAFSMAREPEEEVEVS